MSFDFRGKADAAELTALLADLVRINSVNPFTGELGKDGDGEAGMISYISAFFDREGIEYELQEVLPQRCNLVAHIKGRGCGSLVFEAHTDTVSVDAMVIPPFEPVIRDGLMYGRGSCDCKGSVAAMMYAFAMIKRSGVVPPCDLYFVAAADEEYAYRGVLRFLEDGKRYDGAVVGEPTSMEICIANKGVTRFFIEARGVACHSSMPAKGHSAITDMAKLILKIETEFKPKFSEYVHPLIGARALSVTKLSGGELVNIIPDRCRAEVDVRTLAGDTFEGIKAQLEALIAELKAEDPSVDIVVEPAYLEDQCMETPEDAAVVQAMCSAADKVTGSHSIAGLLTGCDATKFSRAGTPALVFGPGDMGKAHTIDEYIDLAQLPAAAEVYAQICADFKDQ